MFKKKVRPQGIAKERLYDQPSLLEQATSNDGTGEGEEGKADDISETLEELIALRKLKRATGGIDLERLNAGEKKKKPKAAVADGDEKLNDDGTIEGLKGGLQTKDRVRDGGDQTDPNDTTTMTRRLVTNNNFTGQTNTVDVDKHMMAYIEEELQKRKSGGAISSAELSQRASDPRDELYQIAEKYRIEKKEEKEDGNVQLSATMLTAIPEVDLGIDTKLKNIEETEKAKRALFEKRKNAPKQEQESFAAERFFRPQKAVDSELDALAKAKQVMYGRFGAPDDDKKGKSGTAFRREKATDDQTLERLKKRQRK